MKNISIIIVTHNRVFALKNLLKQIFQSSELTNIVEVIVIFNNDSEANYSAIEAEFKNSCHLIRGSFKTPGLARNRGIHQASGEWLLFLDDDISLPPFFFESFQSLVKKHPDAEIIGGPDQTPPESNYLAQALGLALTSPMATAHTQKRHSLINDKDVITGSESNLILCNLWIKSKVFREHKLKFHDGFYRNEENVLLSQSMEKGVKAVYSPEFFVYHFRKTNPFLLLRAVFSSGKHRIKSFLISPSLFKPIFLIPALWVLYLISLVFINLNRFSLSPLVIYLSLSILFSGKVAKDKPQLFIGVLFYQIFINLAYGLGVLFGLTLLPSWKLFNRL